MNKEHIEKCNAPICQCSVELNKEEKNTTVWYPGEAICSMKPHKLFQERQVIINNYIKKNSFKNIEFPYTVEYLEKHTV